MLLLMFLLLGSLSATRFGKIRGSGPFESRFQLKRVGSFIAAGRCVGSFGRGA